MHPSISQAVAAERIREWQQSADAARLGRQAAHGQQTRGRSFALPWQRRHPAAEQPAAVPATVTEEHVAAADGRQPASTRAA